MNNWFEKKQYYNQKPKKWQREVTMKSVRIHLQDIEDVKEFVNTLTRYECRFGLVSEHCIVDPKSLLGMFSLDLKKSMQLDIHADEPLLSTALENIQKYVVYE